MMSYSSDDNNDSKVSGREYETTYAKMVIFGAEGTVKRAVELKTKEELVNAESYMLIKLEEDGDYLMDGCKVGTWELDGSELTITTEIEDDEDDEDDGEVIVSNVLSGDMITMESTFTEDGTTLKSTIVYTKM